jgi:GAF domain-containing protein
MASRRGFRTVLGIPLVREDGAIGCLLLRRQVVEPFSDTQIALLKTFANESVIAIENTRLFDETAQKSHELEIASHRLPPGCPRLAEAGATSY